MKKRCLSERGSCTLMVSTPVYHVSDFGNGIPNRPTCNECSRSFWEVHLVRGATKISMACTTGKTRDSLREKTHHKLFNGFWICHAQFLHFEDFVLFSSPNGIYSDNFDPVLRGQNLAEDMPHISLCLSNF